VEALRQIRDQSDDSVRDPGSLHPAIYLSGSLISVAGSTKQLSTVTQVDSLAGLHVAQVDDSSESKLDTN